MNLKQELKASAAFKHLSDDELEKVLPLCSEENHPAGAELYREGAFADKLYIVVKGRTALDLVNKMAPYGPPSRMMVDLIHPGEAMGWSALVDPHVYTLSCKCVEECRLIALNGPDLKELMSRDSCIGLKIMGAVSKTIATRLTHTRELMIMERGMQMVSNY